MVGTTKSERAVDSLSRHSGKTGSKKGGGDFIYGVCMNFAFIFSGFLVSEVPGLTLNLHLFID